jgi:hypothetical protein
MAMRGANGFPEGDTNGLETAHQNEDGARTVGSSFSSENGRVAEAEWVEQDEPGVYITLTSLPGGGKDLKRVRFRYLSSILKGLFFPLIAAVYLVHCH